MGRSILQMGFADNGYSHYCSDSINGGPSRAIVFFSGLAPRYSSLTNRVIERGYEYLLRNFKDDSTGLLRRFAVANKPGIIKFDLYDNAEMLNLSILLDDKDTVEKLSASIEKYFYSDFDIYSKIDILGTRSDKNTLRWAVMPYLYAIYSKLLKNLC